MRVPHYLAMGGLTACVTGAGVGVDSAWKQKKLKARKMLVNRTDSPASSARGVRQLFGNFTADPISSDYCLRYICHRLSWGKYPCLPLQEDISFLSRLP
jgi:hypothetical protein